ncbi:MULTISPECIES: NADP-dependent malic enzyme [Chryseobacterium]|uniref:Allosteric NADP-dependent malic enzyme n=1 Tax=Chryseobacterium scophthalmum TaxID=59733 RepID=A0A1N6IU83_9FLAO|nr:MULTISPECIES: NADP-dependent malic enzyme [Chryseobacterium]MBM7418751.1 malate dehydrogenase (oxaloacetate-decarboxylating)(NADP+) [Chryseobacterium sp. JUb44]MDH6208664.1 malate dehydrogenase (oxaloacetate-decarboxylating)(NADP+) [Chryseobacterium sp. BIGb0186]WSO11542.1 NADP-dependent malic enzyme [Chryseobacterium scophthalmum]SIO35573.1 allosteric NADP-dependent malic enzyme [Chryseobacterium scophthalmum]
MSSKTHRDEKNFSQAALDYHKAEPKGKIEVIPSKPHSSQRDLSLAYSPGVAIPCLEIEKNPETVYDYTGKGNLVAVISNGTAVLGLGDIGAEASKPVMEGKGLLFKIFADINVFDIEIDEKDPDKFIQIVKGIAPTFGGINLEDIKAPEAFYIEQKLKEELDIPLMHDDQHGTAIISAAALINSLQIANKNIEEVKMVVNGAGAAAIACTNLYISLGLKRENVLMCDSKGVINHKRENLTPEKLDFIAQTDLETLEDAVKGSDVFIGLSKGNVMTPEMLSSMNENPIVFALANPDPEIAYDLALSTRKDVIMATGRSDYPNQVNNVLGFPYIFRGALDVQAKGINEEMKLAAVHAIADLAKEPVPEAVILAYNVKNLQFGREYFIPKPFDNRLITKVSSAVAKAAIESGVARKTIADFDEYETQLLDRMGRDEKLVRMMQNRAKANPKRITLGNAEEYNVLKAAQILYEEGIAHPILLGDKKYVKEQMERFGINIDVPIIDPSDDDQKENRKKYRETLWKLRQRKGMNEYKAKRYVRQRDYFGPLMLKHGDTDGLIIGFSKNYVSTLRPVLEVIEKDKGVDKVAAMMMILSEKKPIFFADTSINQNPTAEDLVNIAKMAEHTVKSFAIEPRIAMLGFENFSAISDTSKKVAKAVNILHEKFPKMIVDGEIQPDFAMNSDHLSDYPFSKLGTTPANTFIFPNLESANLSYKIIRGMKVAQVIGPILMGLKQPVHVLQMRSSVDEIVNLATVAVLDAQRREVKK